MSVRLNEEIEALALRINAAIESGHDEASREHWIEMAKFAIARINNAIRDRDDANTVKTRRVYALQPGAIVHARLEQSAS